MKKIGIIFAMREELDETIKMFDNIIEHSIYNLTIYECSNDSIKCYLVESGIGKVNATRSTQILIDKMNVDYILNVGVAGSISREVNKCDIVIADKLAQHDFDLTVFDREKGEIPSIGKYIECDKYLVDIAKTIVIDTNVTVGVVASGDIFVSEAKMGAKINARR